MPSPPQQATPDLAAEIDSIDWYHTLELAPGVITPGWHDHRPILDQIPLPPSLAGKRCLDVGTLNGFWAFEMERRGAAEVVGIDVLSPEDWDWPAGSDPAMVELMGRRQARGRGFEIASRELGSAVRRIERSVYDLTEADAGRFDLVFVGSILVHLRNPVRALERVRAVCSGTVVVADGIDVPLSLLLQRTPVARLDGRARPWWWYPNTAGLERLVEAAGFDVLERARRYYVPPGRGQPVHRFNPRLLRSPSGRRHLVVAWKGDPHAVLTARPRL